MRRAAPAPAAEAKPAPAAKGGKKVKRAEARPTLVWLGDAKLKELAERINTELGAGTVSIVQAALLVKTDKLIDVALFLRDKNPIKYDYLASLQSVHYEDCIEVNYQLDSTAKPGTVIELRVRTAEAEGQGEVPSLYHVYRGADFQEREVYDMMGVRFTGHPELTRILMWEGYAYHPLRKDFLEPYYEGPTKVFASRVDEGLGQHFRAEEVNPYGTNMKVPKDLQRLGQPLEQRRSQGDRSLAGRRRDRGARHRPVRRQHGAAAPQHARGVPDQPAARRRDDRRPEAGHGLHAP